MNSSSNFEVSESEIRVGFNKIVYDSLKPVLVGLGVLYIIFTVSHALVLAKPVAFPMITASLVTATVFFIFFYILGQWSIPVSWANPLGMIVAYLVMFNVLLHTYLTKAPEQTTNLMLLFVGAGYFFLSSRWFLLVISGGLIGWGSIIWLASSSPLWLHFGFALFTSVILAGLIHTVRKRTLRRLKIMRIQEHNQKAKLEEVIWALQKSEEKYRLMAENSTDMISRHTPEGIYLYASPACRKLLGYEPDELVGHSAYEFFHPDELQEIKKSNSTISEHPTSYTVSYRIRRKDGNYIWFETTSRTVREPETGDIKEIIAVSRDITKRKETENKLERKSIELETIFDSVPAAIWFKDTENRFIRVNRVAAESMGMEPEDIVGKNVSEFFPNQAEHYYEDDLEVIKSGEPKLGIIEQLQTSSGKNIWMRIDRVPYKNENDSVIGVIVFSVDITEQKEMERIKSEFVSTVSHEIRTPLTSILGSLRLITGGMSEELSPQVKQLLDIAYRNSERLTNLINDIMDIEKIESGKMEFNFRPLELMPLIEQAIEDNCPYAKQFDVEFVLKNRLPDAKVNADSERLMQVFANLLSNAAKFSPPNEAVEISVFRHDEVIRVAIIDHGPGIPKKFHEYIFDKFTQADSSDSRQKGGTGLGLSIAKAIVEEHEGKIDFDTEIGGGTTFYFDLPEWQEFRSDSKDSDRI